MSVNASGANAYADLGYGWIRNQAALFRQKQVQLVRPFRVGVAALLARAAGVAREARLANVQVLLQDASTRTLEALVH